MPCSRYAKRRLPWFHLLWPRLPATHGVFLPFRKYDLVATGAQKSLSCNMHGKCASLFKTHRANSGRELVDRSRLVWIPPSQSWRSWERSNRVAKQRHRIFAASELRCDQCSDETFADEPLNRVRRGLVDPLLRSPNCIEWRLAIDRESKLSVRLYKRSRFLDRPPHVASVVQNSPRVDDVKRSGFLRGNIENRNNCCIPVLRWLASREQLVRRRYRILVDIDGEDTFGAERKNRKRMQPGT
ncbi:hypothetical protein ACVWYH_000080 [Bradyrhizobium sp. GM24.11]